MSDSTYLWVCLLTLGSDPVWVTEVLRPSGSSSFPMESTGPSTTTGSSSDEECQCYGVWVTR